MMEFIKTIIKIIINALATESSNALSEAERIDMCAGSNYWA